MPLLTAAALLWMATAWAAADGEREANLRERIATLEGVVNATKNAGEKARMEEQLQRLRSELTVVEEQKAIADARRQLHEGRTSSPIDILRDKLRSNDVSAEDAEARVKQISARRKTAVTERDALASLVDEKNSSSAAQVQLQERIITKSAELKALGLEREEAERIIDLAHDVERLRGRIKTFEATNEHPSLKNLFETYTLLREERKAGGKLVADAADLAHDLKPLQSDLELSQQQLAKFDEDLAGLVKQTSFFTRDSRVERLLAQQRGLKDALTERLPFMTRQVDSIRRSQALVAARQEFATLEVNFQQEQFEALKTGYMRRLRWPAVALTGLILVQLLAGYLLLPLLYKNESLVLARRLVRYILVVAATLVIAGFLFDDLKVIAAAGGLVSAAIVISLQDVCASVFAWFVIMLGSKFGIGDRLEIDGSRGDVIDIDLLRTTLLEVNGWLGTDSPTGRVITLPNNFIFKMKVFNFSHGHPFIWGRIEFTISSGTAVAPALALFERVLEEEGGEQFAAAQAASAAMRRRYGVEDAIYKPKINLLIVDTGVQVNLFFVAHYRQNSATRNKITRRLVAELEKHPEIQLAHPTVQVTQSPHESDTPAAVLGGGAAPRVTSILPSTGLANGNGNGTSGRENDGLRSPVREGEGLRS